MRVLSFAFDRRRLFALCAVLYGIRQLIKRLVRSRLKAKSRVSEHTARPISRTDLPRVTKTIVVETSKGKVRGFTERFDSPKFSGAHREDDVQHSFRGIPFAAPPVDELRFRHAKPHPGWSHVRDATRFGKEAVQNPNFGLEIVLQPLSTTLLQSVFRILFAYGLNKDPFDAQPVSETQSEDCLTLAVTTPSVKGSLPVALWLHGGSFIMGSGCEPLYTHQTGHPLVSRDIVLVQSNYRLGAFGWLKADDGDYNCGLSDQIRALQWIQEEIVNFGGDPTNVTVFGESAGAMCIAALLSCPFANKLFNRAICQSGGGFNAMSLDDAESLRKEMKRILQTKDLKRYTLARFDAAQIYSAAFKINDRFGELPWMPVIDGTMVPGLPQECITDGCAAHVDLLIGTTKHESHLFRALVPIGPINRWTCVQAIKPFVGPAMLQIAGNREEADRLASEIVDAYLTRYAKVHHFGDIEKLSMEDWTTLFFEVATEIIFEAPNSLMAEAHCTTRHKSKRTFKYRFDYEGPRKAAHGIELPFIHGTVVHLDQSEDLQKLLHPDSSMHELVELSDFCMDAWTNFIKFGDPKVDGWTQFTHAHRETYLLDVPSKRHTWRPVDESKDVAGGVHRDDDEAFHLLCEHRLTSKRPFGFSVPDV